VEIAGTGRRDRLHVELVDALRLVGADAAVDDDVHAVLRAHHGARQLFAEERRADLAVGVLQREEAVAGGRERRLADLALDPDIGQDVVTVEQAADTPVEIRDAQDAWRGAGRRLLRLPRLRLLGQLGLLGRLRLLRLLRLFGLELIPEGRLVCHPYS